MKVVLGWLHRSGVVPSSYCAARHGRYGLRDAGAADIATGYSRLLEVF
jgi:hypothetical protein